MKKIFLFLTAIAAALFPKAQAVFAYGYTLTQTIPGTGIRAGEDIGLVEYISNLWIFGIAIGGILTLAIVTYGAIEWTVSAGNPSKIEDAKDRIKQALLGLALLLGAYLILQSINPQLVQIESLEARLDQLLPVLEQTATSTPGVIVEGGILTSAPGCPSCTTINRGVLQAKAAGRRGQSTSAIACLIDNTDLSNPSHPNVATTTPVQISDCLLGVNLHFKLENVARKFPPNGAPELPENQKIYWRVNEAWPPTVPHKSRCHFNGRCADIGVDGGKGKALSDFCGAVNTLVGELMSTGMENATGKAQAATPNFFINEYSQCGGTRFDTTTGGHIHVVIGGE